MDRTILVVDDEENMLALYQRVLGKEGYRVACVPSGHEALALAACGRFDLAIVDLDLPEMDGVGLIEKLRAHDRRIPIIVISARPPWEQEESARRMRCAACLVKPVNIQQLKGLVRSLVSD